MKQVTLFIAISLDGYIADRSGGVDWLSGTSTEDTDSYDAFIRGIDTVIMGGNTYRQIITQLSPETWPYPELESYVVTRHSIPDGKIRYIWCRNPPALWSSGCESRMERDLDLRRG